MQTAELTTAERFPRRRVAIPLDTEWQAQARCEGMHPDLFFPDKAADWDTLSLCRSECPVQMECLEHAFMVGEYHGVWGGFGERLRARMRRRWLAGADLRQTVAWGLAWERTHGPGKRQPAA